MAKPRVNGNAAEKIAWLGMMVSGVLGELRSDGTLAIVLGESYRNGQDMVVVLSPSGSWWIEHET